MEFDNFREAIRHAAVRLYHEGQLVDSKSWQGLTSDKEFITQEIVDFNFTCGVPTSLELLQEEVRPNLPWADDHFLERVGGEPLNPGEQYKNWPYYKKDIFREEEGGKFTHTYMERFWTPHKPGIRYPFGNLQDMVEMLIRDPLTRQAYLPIWFPEDTGAHHGGRLPCTLGYHFLCRGNKFHIFYPIRSCDLLRHFQDDIYLACRLLVWVLGELKVSGNKFWVNVEPGNLSMSIYSLHIFEQDLPTLKYKLESGQL